MPRGWLAVFALETMLYAVGTAFIVLLMVKDNDVNIYRNAASTDPSDRPAQPPRLPGKRAQRCARRQANAASR